MSSSKPAASGRADGAAHGSSLAHSAFVPFVLARMLAMFAQQMQAVVVAWQVYDITRNPVALAMVGLAQFIPMALLLVPAGDLSDRMSRKRILMMSWLLALACSALLLWQAGASHQEVHWIYATLVLFGCSRAFTGPALQSLRAELLLTFRHLLSISAAVSLLGLAAALAMPDQVLRGREDKAR